MDKQPDMEELVESAEPVDEFVAVDETETSTANADPDFMDQMQKQTHQDNENELEMPPKCDYKYESTEGTKQELDDWFDYKDNWIIAKSKTVFEDINTHASWKTMSEQDRKECIRKLLQKCEPEPCEDEDRLVQLNVETLDGLFALCYVVQGTFAEVTSLQEHLTAIKANCMLMIPHFAPVFRLLRLCLDYKCPDELSESSDAVGSLFCPENSLDLDLVLKLASTVVYFILETCRSDPGFTHTLRDASPPILNYFINLFERFRWLDGTVDSVIPVNKLLMIFWKAMLCVFGDHHDLILAKRYTRLSYGLPDDEEQFSSHVDMITASPLDYHAFRADVISRYPSYCPPPSLIPKELDATESLSQYIEIARPSHAQVSNQVLPAPVAHIATPAPSPPLSPAIMTGQKVKKSLFMTNQSFPFLFPSTENVPKSIVEAGELFASRVRMTPAMRQLWDERDMFMKVERGWSDVSDQRDDITDYNDHLEKDEKSTTMFKDTPERLQAVETFYRDCYPRLNSLTNILLKEILQNSLFMQSGARGETSFDEDSFNDRDDEASPKSSSSSGGGIELDPVIVREKDITIKACSAILELLTGWFKASHILKFEYLSALLFDSRYYLVVYKHLYGIPLLEKVLDIPDSLKLNFFTVCKSLSKGDTLSTNVYGQTSCRSVPLISPETAHNMDSVEPFSKRVIFTLISLTKVLKRMVKHKVQRLVMVAELPSDILKKTLSLYQSDLWRTVLEIFKEQVPYHGKKWKYNNMDIISFIYLYCRAKLRDEWLSRSDVSAELEDAYVQEVALRALIQFHNNRKYVKDVSSELDDDFQGFSLN